MNDRWREIVSRATMVVVALVCLSGAAALFFVAWRMVNFSMGTSLIFGFLAAALTYLGLFLIKRSIVPSEAEETPPLVVTGADDWTDSWWVWLLWLFTW